MTGDVGGNDSDSRRRTMQWTFCGAVASLLGIAVHLIARMLYGYGVSTGAYLCLGVCSMVLLCAAVPTFCFSARGLIRRDRVTINLFALLVSLLSAASWIVALGNYDDLRDLGAKVRVSQLGGQVFAQQLCADARDEWVAAGLTGGLADLRGKSMPVTFKSLHVTHMREWQSENYWGLALLSDHPARSSWCVILEDRASNNVVKSQECGRAVHGLVLRK